MQPTTRASSDNSLNGERPRPRAPDPLARRTQAPSRADTPPNVGVGERGSRRAGARPIARCAASPAATASVWRQRPLHRGVTGHGMSTTRWSQHDATEKTRSNLAHQKKPAEELTGMARPGTPRAIFVHPGGEAADGRLHGRSCRRVGVGEEAGRDRPSECSRAHRRLAAELEGSCGFVLRRALGHRMKLPSGWCAGRTLAATHHVLIAFEASKAVFAAQEPVLAGVPTLAKNVSARKPARSARVHSATPYTPPATQR